MSPEVSAQTAPTSGSKRAPWFHWYVLATVLATYGLIVLGGVVRTTGSGDACPDWPRCHGQIIPPFETGVLIEFSHRLVASVVGFLVLGVALAAWRWRRDQPVVVWGATLALGLLILQVILGGITVLNELPPEIVTAHLATATALLTTLIVITGAAWPAGAFGGDLPDARRVELARFRTLAIVAVLAVFGLMLTGSYVTGTGAGLAFRDWPLFDGRLWPEGGRLAMIHAGHRFAALIVGLFLAHTVAKAWRRLRWHRGVMACAAAAGVLFVAQALVGAANIWTLLQPAANSTHLGLAVAVLGTLVTAAVVAHRSAAPESTRMREQAPAAPSPRVREAAEPVGGSGGA